MSSATFYMIIAVIFILFLLGVNIEFIYEHGGFPHGGGEILNRIFGLGD